MKTSPWMPLAPVPRRTAPGWAGVPLLGALIACSAVVLTGQPAATGTVEGRVLNATSGTYLNQARVVVQGTRLEAVTNQEGEYRIVGIPAGLIQLGAAYTGLSPLARTIEVLPGRTVRVDFDLTLAGEGDARPGVVQMEAFTVEERELTAQGVALHEQRSAANIRNVVAIEEFGDLGITNPGHFLTYVPGVTNVYNTTGEVAGIGLRGMDSSGTLVTFDGATGATNDPNSRAYDFSGTGTANIERIEVTKVPTPDLPANAVGGSINLVTKSGFSRRTPLLRYNVFLTAQAKGSHGNIAPPFSRRAGPDEKTTTWPIRPGFDLSYTRPVNPSLALTFNAGHNARYQDREYMSPTWNRVTLIQTSGLLNSVLNIFTKDLVALGADWRRGRSALKARIDYTRQDAYTRQNIFNYSFGGGATGGAAFTQGANTGTGSLGQTLGLSINQYRRLLNGRINYTYTGDRWRFDGGASFSEARRVFSDIDEGLFGNASLTLPSVVVSATNLDGIYSMTLPRFTVRSRTGEPIEPYDVRRYTLNTTSSSRMYFQNHIATVSGSAQRQFSGRFPVSVKAGGSIERTQRDTWTESMTWSFRPPPAAGGQLVGNHDLVAEEYSARRIFNGGVNIHWFSVAKAYQLFREHPEYFILNEVSAYTNRANSSRRLQETISAAYLRADAKLADNRLWLVAGGRFERTDDEGWGPLNDIRATYARDRDGNILLGTNGRPMQVSTDALTLARLQIKERAMFSRKHYQDFYPSLNASYNVTDSLVLRAAVANTIGRPNVSFIIPGTTISDPSAAAPTITVVNTGLKPWTSTNYDLTAEAYERKGATLTLSGFRKEISDFFTTVRIPLTPELLEAYGLPADLLNADYDLVTRENSPQAATLSGLEWSWRQTLRPWSALPNWMRSFGFFVNGTHLRVGGPGGDNFSGYSTRILNAGATYARARFSAKINVTRSNGPRNASVAGSATTPAGTYSGLAPRTQVGGSFEYRFHRNLTLHFSGQNLSNALYRNLTFAPGAPAYVQPTNFRDNGIEYVVGVKGEF